MATYFHVNSEIQAGDGGLQTLYLMNPNYIPNNNRLLVNPVNISHAPPQPQPPQHLLWSSSDAHMASLAAAAAGNSAPSSVSVVSSGISSMQSVTLGPYKYLRPAQELLDEVVKVVEDEFKEKMKLNREPKMAAVDHHQEQNGKSPLELTTAQRQELQIKKAKLVNMLDEVEQRYKQYHHQMQSVVAAFEQAAGFGSAKSYTAVALRTISKQFRCLKDAISAQLKATGKKLGEDDCLGAKITGSSKLRFVQQLGMIQHHSWRAQRGLPERAVTILRAWLFEHFLHPYPKDSDKQHLAKQTGLTRSQVSNWFINARVRLWKPMVEEMYLEEVKEKEGNGYESKDSTHQLEQIKALQAYKAEKSTEFSNSIISTSPMGATLQQQTSFNLVGPSDLETFNPDHHQLAAPTFRGNNGVSLSLGLPYCELGSTEPDFCPESSGYGSIEIENRKRFAAQLFPADFMTS